MSGKYLPAASEGWGKVLFSQASVCSHPGEGGTYLGQVQMGGGGTYPGQVQTGVPPARVGTPSPHQDRSAQRTLAARRAVYTASCVHAGGHSCSDLFVVSETFEFGMLQACRSAGTVKRVVVTSSIAAITADFDAPDKREIKDIYDEKRNKRHL